MRIPNPFPRYTVRAICKPGDVQVVQCVRGDLEVPEGIKEAIIDPVKDLGRGNLEPLGQAKIWSERWGVMELKDHAKKMQIEVDAEKLEADKKKQAERKAKEARERAEKKAKKPESEAKKFAEKVEKVEEKNLDMGKELEL